MDAAVPSVTPRACETTTGQGQRRPGILDSVTDRHPQPEAPQATKHCAGSWARRDTHATLRTPSPPRSSGPSEFPFPLSKSPHRMLGPQREVFGSSPAPGWPVPAWPPRRGPSLPSSSRDSGWAGPALPTAFHECQGPEQTMLPSVKNPGSCAAIPPTLPRDCASRKATPHGSEQWILPAARQANANARVLGPRWGRGNACGGAPHSPVGCLLTADARCRTGKRNGRGRRR